MKAFRNLALICAMTGLAACTQDAPVRIEQNDPQAYTVISETADSSGAAIRVAIALTGPTTESQAKATAETAAGRYAAVYRTVTVSTFRSSQSVDGKPFVVSRYEAGRMTHEVQDRAESQKIPTH